MVSCQKGPTFHAYACQIGPFWQDTFDITAIYRESIVYGLLACPVKFTYSVVVLCFVVFISPVFLFNVYVWFALLPLGLLLEINENYNLLNEQKNKNLYMFVTKTGFFTLGPV